MEREHTSTRRQLLQFGVAATVASACGGCKLFGSRKPDAVVKPDDGAITLTAEESSKLLQSEGALLVKPDNAADKIIVIHAHDGALYADSATCMHMGCDVLYDKELGHIRCPCHGSQYALNGANLKGPANRPLKSYPVRVQDGRVVISGLTKV
jgi:cytochrome b6-f complex iron-sulfur subunit